MFAGNYFSYNGVNSEQYELQILIVDEEQNTKIGGELDYTSFYNRYNGRTEIINAVPSESEFSGAGMYHFLYYKKTILIGACFL